MKPKIKHLFPAAVLTVCLLFSACGAEPPAQSDAAALTAHAAELPPETEEAPAAASAAEISLPTEEVPTEEAPTEEAPTEAPKPVYDADAALRYAADHWNDGDGLCAEFVSRCLQAGGIDVFADGCTTLQELLTQAADAEIFTMDFPTGKTIDISQVQERLVPGDVVMYFCETCILYDGKPYIHTLLYTRCDEDGYMMGYSHNPAEGNTEKYWYDLTCYGCGQYLEKLVFFHFI